MNGCHQDAGHEGQQPEMAVQMQKAISSCEGCIQHEGSCAKVPLWPNIVTAPLELLHVDFSSTENTVELDQPPNMVNLLVFCDHFTKNVMAYVTPVQTAKTVATFLWQGYISIFRELCEIMDIQKVRISPYHAQTNGQVEQAHQMLMHMIGKLSKDWKVDWPKHLPELVHAYNCTRFFITRYSPDYLVFGCWPYLPINFYFSMIRGMIKHQHVDHCIAELCEWLQEAFKEAQVQSTSEVDRQKWYYDRKANAISLEPHGLVLAKADAYRGRRKVKDQWEEEHTKWSTRLLKVSLPTSWRTSRQDAHESSTETDFFSSLLEGTPLCTVVWAKWARCTTTTLEEQTPEGSETEEVP